MKELEEKIVREGTVLPGNILKVDNFLNHQLDVAFIMQMGKEIARLYEGCGVDKILTIESSGIAVAAAAANYMNVPVVFAKKNKSSNISDNLYSSLTHSFTHGNDYTAVVSKDFINENNHILIVDDFLALGSAVHSLKNIVMQSGASLVGCAIVIEKGFQGGGDKLRSEGIRVESLAIIDSMEDGTIKYRPQ